MPNYTLGKRADIPIPLIGKGSKCGNRNSGWWQSMKPCPICRGVEGKRVYLMTNGKKFYCNHCEDKGRAPKKDVGPQEHMRKKELGNDN